MHYYLLVFLANFYLAHYNGLRLGLLHSDASDTNVWFKVKSLDVKDIVPEWPSEQGKYTKRAGILGDWGYAEDQLKLNDSSSPGHMTVRINFMMTAMAYQQLFYLKYEQGTFPFTATELLSPDGLKGRVRHTAHHDLESFFWILWVTSINLVGPFNLRRAWKDQRSSNHNMDPAAPTASSATSSSAAALTSAFLETTTQPTQQTFPGHVRTPEDDIPNLIGVPVWATPGLHSCSEEDVYVWKRGIPELEFSASISPYWTRGAGGQVFLQSMQKLRDRFVWKTKYNDKLQRAVPSKPDEPMTHTFFLETLKLMRDSISDSEDKPTEADRERGRQTYSESVQQGLYELPVLESVGAQANVSRTGVRGMKKLKSGSKRTREDGLEVALQKRSKSAGNRLEERPLRQDGGAGGSTMSREVVPSKGGRVRSKGVRSEAKRKSTGRKQT